MENALPVLKLLLSSVSLQTHLCIEARASLLLLLLPICYLIRVVHCSFLCTCISAKRQSWSHCRNLVFIEREKRKGNRESVVD